VVEVCVAGGTGSGRSTEVVWRAGPVGITRVERPHEHELVGRPALMLAEHRLDPRSAHPALLSLDLDADRDRLVSEAALHDDVDLAVFLRVPVVQHPRLGDYDLRGGIVPLDVVDHRLMKV